MNVISRKASHHLYGTPVIAVEIERGPFRIKRERTAEFELQGRHTPYGHVPWEVGELDVAVEKAMDDARLVVASMSVLAVR